MQRSDWIVNQSSTASFEKKILDDHGPRQCGEKKSIELLSSVIIIAVTRAINTNTLVYHILIGIFLHYAEGRIA